MKFKISIVFLAILLMAFSSIKNDFKTEYFHNLRLLKHSNPPRMVSMVQVNNLSSDVSIISNGILFTYKNRGANKVYIAGNFSQWKLLAMSKSKHGIWYFFYNEDFTEKKVRYKFNVNSTWITDPLNVNREDDNMGSYVSTVTTAHVMESKQVTYKSIQKNLIEFRIYKPEAKIISVVGDFNMWNPENDLLGKGSDGIWRLKKKISSGFYRYKFIVDGRWIPDFYNKESTLDNTGDLCSVLRVK